MFLWWNKTILDEERVWCPGCVFSLHLVFADDLPQLWQKTVSQTGSTQRGQKLPDRLLSSLPHTPASGEQDPNDGTMIQPEEQTKEAVNVCAAALNLLNVPFYRHFSYKIKTNACLEWSFCTGERIFYQTVFLFFSWLCWGFIFHIKSKYWDMKSQYWDKTLKKAKILKKF